MPGATNSMPRQRERSMGRSRRAAPHGGRTSGEGPETLVLGSITDTPSPVDPMRHLQLFNKNGPHWDLLESLECGKVWIKGGS
jgi:hypothetical protein